MKIALFDTKAYDKKYFLEAAKDSSLEPVFIDSRLNEETVHALNGKGFQAVVCFVHDDISSAVCKELAQYGVTLIAMRCAGFNNVHLETAKELGITVVRVPAYSPYSVAEHTMALLLTLNRHIHRAYNRVREGDYSINGLLGFDLHGKTLGVIGTGKIGVLVCKIAKLGFGMKVIAYDLYEHPEVRQMGIDYVTLDELLTQSDVISLHCPLLPETKYLVNKNTIAKMKRGVFLLNTSRGLLLDTKAVIEGLKTKQIGAVAIDVYENEDALFYEDKSGEILTDDVLARLTTFSNVIVTAHQAYFTREAMVNISETTVKSLLQHKNKQTIDKEVLV